MIYFIILAIICCSFFAFSKFFKKFRQNNTIGINFYMTLIATVVGVLLAIILSESTQNKKQKEEIIAYLNIASLEIDKINKNNLKLLDLNKDYLEKGTIISTYIKLPELAFKILDSEKVLNSVSPEFFSECWEIRNDLEIYCELHYSNKIHNQNDLNPDRINNFLISGKQVIILLEQINEVVKIEARDLENKLSKEEKIKLIKRVQKNYQKQLKDVFNIK